MSDKCKPFDFRRRSPFSGLHLTGTVVEVAGAVILSGALIGEEAPVPTNSWSVGVVAVLIGGAIVSSYTGILIDAGRRRTKAYLCLLGGKLGQWSALGEVAGIRVFSVEYRAGNTPNGVSPTLSGKVTGHHLVLYSEEGETLLSLTYPKKEKALRAGEQLAFRFKVSLDLPDA